jgi:dephospho-CoA kinase
MTDGERTRKTEGRTVHRVALTGGIATGKSYIAGRMRAAGVAVVDADRLAREAVGRGSDALELVRRRFGARALTPDGEMDRRYVAAIVFADEAARRDLEAIVHPVVRSGIEEFFAAAPREAGFAVADIPLLYETARAGAFDAVIVAACAPELQIARVMARDGSTRADAERRLRAQLPIEEKASRADYVIRTDGTHAQTDAAVSEVIESLRRRFTSRP